MKSIVKHQFEPIFDTNSKILILGTIPSVKSRSVGFYYGHPKNRFWEVLEEIFEEKIKDKREFLLRRRIALWDVLASCEIEGSSDASIKKAIPNDLEKLIHNSHIKTIFTTGKTAYKYYMQFFKDKVDLPVYCLPSPSPANCRVKKEELIKSYQWIKEKLVENDKKKKI